MVFSSLPSYLDPPNWSQQQPAGGIGVGTVAGSGGDHEIFQLPPPLLAPPLPLASGGDGRSVQIMEHGRMTKLPQPDTAMKCPRCESTNTKFCYFNNYSLSQPRHFCKTCRRYWTRGGALRNVPVGGGCRRNKKSTKGSRGSTCRSKSPSTSNNNTPTSPNSSEVLGHYPHTTRPPQFPILPPLHHFGGGDLGITFGGGNGTAHDQLMNNLGHDHDSSYPNSKLTHFPYMYGEGPSNYDGQVGGMLLKMEENHQQQQQQGMNNLSRNFLGISGNDQFLGTSNVAWSTTDLSGFPSSTTTTTHLL